MKMKRYLFLLAAAVVLPLTMAPSCAPSGTSGSSPVIYSGLGMPPLALEHGPGEWVKVPDVSKWMWMGAAAAAAGAAGGAMAGADAHAIAQMLASKAGSTGDPCRGQQPDSRLKIGAWVTRTRAMKSETHIPRRPHLDCQGLSNLVKAHGRGKLGDIFRCIQVIFEKGTVTLANGEAYWNRGGADGQWVVVDQANSGGGAVETKTGTRIVTASPGKNSTWEQCANS